MICAGCGEDIGDVSDSAPSECPVCGCDPMTGADEDGHVWTPADREDQ